MFNTFFDFSCFFVNLRTIIASGLKARTDAIG